MFAHEIDQIKDTDFKRLVGVRKPTFLRMVEIHQEAIETDKKRKGFGRPRALCPENEVLLTLTYYREYRTYLSVAQSFGVSEPTAFRTIQAVEKHLIGHPDFQLRGKKSLLEERDSSLVVDVTESTIERPQKNNVESIVVRRNVTPLKVN
jgi:hypothetical protein